MSAWTLESCRACLLQDEPSAMHDLKVFKTKKLYSECSNCTISGTSGNTPHYLCDMCYKLCELIQGFRKRCKDTEKKLMRGQQKKQQDDPLEVPVENIEFPLTMKDEPENQAEIDVPIHDLENPLESDDEEIFNPKGTNWDKSPNAMEPVLRQLQTATKTLANAAARYNEMEKQKSEDYLLLPLSVSDMNRLEREGNDSVLTKKFSDTVSRMKYSDLNHVLSDEALALYNWTGLNSKRAMNSSKVFQLLQLHWFKNCANTMRPCMQQESKKLLSRQAKRLRKGFGKKGFEKKSSDKKGSDKKGSDKKGSDKKGQKDTQRGQKKRAKTVDTDTSDDDDEMAGRD